MRPGIAGSHHHPSGDPYWANVISLLHFNGTPGSKVFTDEKGVVWAATGNAVLSSTHSLFGGNSLSIDYGSYISATLPGFGTQDYTVESFEAGQAADGRCIFDNRSVSLSLEGISAYEDTVPYAPNNYAGLTAINNLGIIAGTATPFSSSFVHWAVTRQSGVLRGFMNGVLQFTVTDARALNSGPVKTFWGSNCLNTQSLGGGYLGECRITLGVARYTSSFAPPTAPFPNF